MGYYTLFQHKPFFLILQFFETLTNHSFQSLFMTEVDLEACLHQDLVFISMFFSSDRSQEDISDSETEDQAELRTDDWLIFQSDKEVREHC